MKIIGNKKEFAIQYSLESFVKGEDFILNGAACLWINNFCLGDYENVSPIYGLYNSLKLLFNIKNDFFEESFLNSKSPKDLLEKIQPDFFIGDSFFDSFKNEDEAFALIHGHKYSFTANEAFDAFFIYCFIYENNYNFVWTLFDKDNNGHTKLIHDYDTLIVHTAKVTRDVFNEVFLEFKNDLLSYWKF